MGAPGSIALPRAITLGGRVTAPRNTIKFTLEIAPMTAAISALAELAERFPETRERLVDALESGTELFRIDRDSGAAARAGELVMRLEPSNFLRGLMAAADSGAA